MCEPAHSIVQFQSSYKSSEAEELPFGDGISFDSRLQAALGETFKNKKRIGEWYHFSKFGAGHSCAMDETAKNTRYLPKPILYEGFWWDRGFCVDGCYPPFANKLAKKAAHEYHNFSVMGNMKIFRRFLEQSMRTSQHPDRGFAYVDKLMSHVFNVQGSNALIGKFHRVFGRNYPIESPFRISGRRNLEKGIKIVMGVTRKRNYFQPHFADDANMWS